MRGPVLLNLTAAYALRAMAVLTTLAPGEALNAAELAERTRVPQQYLSKVMRKLVLGKLVRARRGHGGGFSLMRQPSAIRLADVLRAMDLDFDGGCAFGFAQCDPQNPCVLHPIWSQLQQELDEWARGWTLGDIDSAPPARVRRSR